MKTDQAIVEIVLKGQQANATLKDIERSASALRAQLKRLPADSQEFADKSKELQKVNTRLASIRNDLKGTSESFKQTGNAFSNLTTRMLERFSVFTVVIGTLRELWSELKHGVQLQREFEKSIQNLSAITGAEGKDLEFYKDKALEMSMTVEGGAKAVVEAYKLIGSAKPELLANKEALTEVTQAAILLAHASGMELPEAATKLTDAMNQFGAPASQAAKYVDALAAAAKYGAAEVPDITDALLKFGTSAKSFNVDIYESAAAIELLAEKGIKGADAGTALRNILTKLSAADVLHPEALNRLEKAGVDIKILMDKTIPLADRLKELSKITGDASAIFKVFGEENKNAGEIIISNLPRLAQLTGQIKETGVASDQAAKNMNTLDQAMINAGNSWDNFLLGLTSGGLGNAMKTEVQKASMWLTIFGMILGDWKKQELGGFAKEVAKMSDATKKYLADQLQLEIESNLIMLREANGWSKKRILAYEKEIRDKVERLKIYRAAMGKDNDAEVTGTAETSAKKIGIIKQLQDDIQALTEQRVNATTREEIRDLNGQIKRKQELLDALLGKEKKYADELKGIRDKIQKMREETSLYGLSDIEKDKAKAFDEYEKFRDEINKNALMKEDEKNRALQALDDSHYKKLREIDEKYMQKTNDEKEKFVKEYNDFTNNQRENEINEANAQYDKLYALAEGDAQKQLELKAALDQKLADIDKKYLQGAGEAGTNTAATDPLSNKVNQYAGYLQSVDTLAQNYAQIQANRQQDEQTRSDAKMQNDLDREKRLLDMKIISQKTYDDRVKKINDEKTNRDRLARNKELGAQKNAARFSASIDFLTGAAKTYAQYGFTPVGLIAMAAGAALELSKMAVLNSTPVPQYAQGGLHDPNGYVNSETMFSSSTGQPFIAGERGAEWIAPNWMLNEPVIANQIGILEAVRQRGRGFAGGGSTQTAPVPSFAGGGLTNTGSSQSNAQLVAVISRLSEQIDRGIGVNYDLLTKTTKSIESAKNGSAVN